MEATRVSLTIPKEIIIQSDKIAEDRLEDRSTVMRELLSLGLQQYNLQKALMEYGSGKISLGKAAELGGVSLWKFLDTLSERKIPIRHDLGGIKEEIISIRATTYND